MTVNLALLFDDPHKVAKSMADAHFGVVMGDHLGKGWNIAYRKVAFIQLNLRKGDRWKKGIHSKQDITYIRNYVHPIENFKGYIYHIRLRLTDRGRRIFYNEVFDEDCKVEITHENIDLYIHVYFDNEEDTSSLIATCVKITHYGELV